LKCNGFSDKIRAAFANPVVQVLTNLWYSHTYSFVTLSIQTQAAYLKDRDPNAWKQFGPEPDLGNRASV
jgi:hypothetical protein